MEATLFLTIGFATKPWRSCRARIAAIETNAVGWRGYTDQRNVFNAEEETRTLLFGAF